MRPGRRSTLPRSGRWSPARTRSSVVLPVPLAPIKTTTSPARPLMSRPSSNGSGPGPADTASRDQATAPVPGGETERAGRSAGGVAAPGSSGSGDQPGWRTSDRSGGGLQVREAVLGDDHAAAGPGELSERAQEQRAPSPIQLRHRLVEHDQ